MIGSLSLSSLAVTSITTYQLQFIVMPDPTSYVFDNCLIPAWARQAYGMLPLLSTLLIAEGSRLCLDRFQWSARASNCCMGYRLRFHQCQPLLPRMNWEYVYGMMPSIQAVTFVKHPDFPPNITQLQPRWGKTSLRIHTLFKAPVNCYLKGCQAAFQATYSAPAQVSNLEYLQ